MSHAVCSHWGVLQVVDKDLCFYDSTYSNIAADTLQVIAQLVRSSDKGIDIKLMNVAKQYGSVDCGLYAIATVTCLALEMDPTIVVFHQDEMRCHLIKIFETKSFHFPVQKYRRPVNRVNKIVHCKLYCMCRQPNDDDDPMI